jgi:hypothetical protein
MTVLQLLQKNEYCISAFVVDLASPGSAEDWSVGQKAQRLQMFCMFHGVVGS